MPAVARARVRMMGFIFFMRLLFFVFVSQIFKVQRDSFRYGNSQSANLNVVVLSEVTTARTECDGESNV